MRKGHLFQDTVKLRKEGYSYSYIQRQIGVSKSSLSVWLSNTPYKRNQETLNRITKARLLANEAQRAKKRKSLEDAKELLKSLKIPKEHKWLTKALILTENGIIKNVEDAYPTIHVNGKRYYFQKPKNKSDLEFFPAHSSRKSPPFSRPPDFLIVFSPRLPQIPQFQI